MHYIQEIHLDWDKTCRFAFNNCSNPDDDQLGIQIVKVYLLMIANEIEKLVKMFRICIELVVVGHRMNTIVRH